MAHPRKVSALLAGLLLLVSHRALAQATTPATERFFLNINLGAQLGPRTLTTATVQPIYGETATTTATQDVKRGMLVDLGVGYRVYGDMFAGIVGTRFKDLEEARWSATVPHPLIFERPLSTSGTVTDLRRDEYGFSPHIGWAWPLTDSFDIVVAGGVTFMFLKQDRLAASRVVPGTQTVVMSVVNEKANGVGPYGAVDIVYNATSKLGVGAYVRFSGAEVDLTSAPDHNLGGLMGGAGVRLRF